jgi:hypothetical protein
VPRKRAWSRRRFRLPLPSVAKDVLFAAAAFAVAVWYGADWFGEGLPALDFPGNLALLDALTSQPITKSFSQWSDKWFCGAPTAPLVSNLPAFASYAPLVGQMDTLSALKAGGVFFFGLAAVGTYVLLRMLTRKRWAAALGALVFALHPIGIAMSVSTGHTNFPPLYAAMPFVFAAALAYARRPSLGKLLWFSGITAVMLWIDSERALFITAFAFAFYLIMAALSLSRKNSKVTRGVVAFCLTKRSIAAGLCIAWAVAGVGLPIFLASRHLALFAEEEKANMISFFSLNNPLFLVDRAGSILKDTSGVLPDEFTANSARFYLGVVPLAASCASVVLARKAHLRRLAWFALAALLLSIWVAAGNMSLYEGAGVSFGKLLRESPESLLKNGTFLVQMAVLFVSMATLVVLVRRRRRRDGADRGLLLLVIPVLATAFLIWTPFVWLRRAVFFIGYMRSPTWFLSCLPAFVLACGTAVFLATLLGRIRNAVVRSLVVATLFAAVVWDFYPYRREFSYYYRPEVVSEAAQVSSFLANEPADGRVMSACCYSPFGDMIIGRSGRDNGWGWLNWMSPAAINNNLMGEVLTDMDRNQEKAATLAGFASVRYLVSYSPEDKFESRTALFRKVAAVGKFVIYENAAWRPFIQAYACQAQGWAPKDAAAPELLHGMDARQLKRDPGNIALNATFKEPALIVASESYFPGWSCQVDGASAPVVLFGGALLCARVPAGQHTVSFHYRAPWVYYASYATSGAFVLFAAAVAIVSIARRLRPDAPRCAEAWKRK